MSKEAEKTEKKVIKAAAVDKKAFRERKLAIMNEKDGAIYQRNAARVMQNNS